MLPAFLQFLTEILGFLGSAALNFLAVSWWFWAFLILAPLTHSAWFFWRKSVYKKMDWIILEIKMPREIKRNPRAMEQVFTTVYSMRNSPGTLAEKWWDGEITRWYSFEIVTFGGETHFYVRVYYKQKGLMEAAFLSYYPDLEIVQVDDYIDRLPKNAMEMYNQGYDVWGSDLILTRESAYPIKTYEDFESPDEDKQYDTMSSYLELFSSLKKEEIIAIQILIAPTDLGWWKKWKGLVDNLKKSGDEEGHKLGTATSFPSDYGLGPLPMFEVTKPTKDDMKFLKTAFRTPGETDILAAIGKNLSKVAFDTLIRFIYLSPKSMYMDSVARRGVKGIFNQFSSLDLNSFDFNGKTAVGTARVLLFHFPFIFPKKRGDYKKERLIYNFRRREIPEEEFVGKFMTSKIFNWNFHAKRFEMNTECLATIFHPPTILSLTAPHIKRVESRKGGPPAGLAIFGGEENVEKLQ